MGLRKIMGCFIFYHNIHINILIMLLRTASRTYNYNWERLGEKESHVIEATNEV